jgi:hypothetical protein
MNGEFITNRIIYDLPIIYKYTLYKNIFTVIIPIPENYHKTKLYYHLIENDEPLAEINFEINTDKLYDDNDEIINPFIEENINNIKTQRYFRNHFKKETKRKVHYLHRFYVNTNYSQASIEEKQSLKGIGKEMLCFCMNKCLENNFILKNDAIILLASGGVCHEEYSKNDNDSDILLLYNKYPIALSNYLKFVKLKNIKINNKSLKNLICKLQDNEKLVKYYTLYGFQLVNDTINGEDLMISTIQKLIDNCKPRI